jgi:hypothetical protein
MEASRNLKSTFRQLKMQKNLKTTGAYTESSTDMTFKAFKKWFISWHCPFKSTVNQNVRKKALKEKLSFEWKRQKLVSLWGG